MTTWSKLFYANGGVQFHLEYDENWRCPGPVKLIMNSEDESAFRIG